MFLHDFRFALRRLARSPGFSATVVLLLGLAIGANACLFSVLYGLLYKPLPFADAQRLVALDTRMTNMAMAFDVGMSVPLFEATREHARSLDGIAGYRSRDRELRSAADAGAVQVWHAAFVQPSLARLLGVRPALGRLFADTDASRGAAPAALISWDAWQTRYGGAADAIGKTLALEDGDWRVVGVLPRGFAFPNTTTQLWLPLTFTDAQRAPAQAGSFGDLDVVARLAPQATAAAANAEIAGLARELPGLKEIVDLVGLKISVKPLRDLWLGGRRAALELMLLAVGLVLLVATANICNLYIARRLARRHELALLDALGAGPWRRLREAVAETCILSGAGAGIGAALVTPGIALLQRFDLIPTGTPQRIGLDAATLAFVAAVAALLALVMAASALWLQHRNAALEIRAGGTRATWSRGAQRARHGLIVAQIALTAALLVGVGLLLRSSQRLLAEDVGFDRANLAITDVTDLPKQEPGVAPDPATTSAAAAATRAFVERCRALPGVASATLATVAPFGWSMSVGNFTLPGDTREASAQPTANRAYVGADFFRTLGTPLLRGRAFTADETRNRADVAIVDAEFARAVYADRDPIGQRFTMGADTPEKTRELTIVGVVPTLKLQALDEKAQRPTVFQPDEYPLNAMLLLRTRADPATLAGPVREALHEAAPRARLRDLVSMQQRIGETVRDRTRLNALLELLGAMALTLAAVGLYAVLAYAVRMRSAEFGVRMALGATSRRVLAGVLLQGARLIAAGVLVALPLAWLVGRVLAARLYQVGTADAVTLGTVAGILAAVALLACWLPARRAAATDPIQALRDE
jgi:predicted permease